MPLLGGVLYAQDESEITYVLGKLDTAYKAGLVCGLDTEFYNVNIGEQSCAGRAKLHFLSVAWPEVPVRKTARGVGVVSAAVFTSDALDKLRHWLESDAPKAIHNAPVDLHTLRNSEICVGNPINTLALARWAWPERARGAGFTLDALGRDFLGVGKMSTFDEIFTETRTEYRSKWKTYTACECGARPCRKRTTTPGHSRIEHQEEIVTEHQVDYQIPLESVVYGHPRFVQAVGYSAQDAILAVGIEELARRKMGSTIIEVPWLD